MGKKCLEIVIDRWLGSRTVPWWKYKLFHHKYTYRCRCLSLRTCLLGNGRYLQYGTYLKHSGYFPGQITRSNAFEIEIATLSNYFKEVTIVLDRFSHRLVPKKRKKNWKGKNSH